MKAKNFALAILGCLLIGTTSLAQEQSLGDVARKEREKRNKQPRTAVKVYTNEDIPAARLEGKAQSADEKSAAGAEKSSGSEAKTEAQTEPSSAGPSDQSKKSEDKKKTKDYWQEKFRAARENLARAQEEQQLAEDELGYLQKEEATRLNAQSDSDLTSRLAAKTAEVDLKRSATAKAKKALDELEKQFSESGAPKEWGQAG